jgi:hypothetical protein
LEWHVLSDIGCVFLKKRNKQVILGGTRPHSGFSETLSQFWLEKIFDRGTCALDVSACGEMYRWLRWAACVFKQPLAAIAACLGGHVCVHGG